MSIIQKACRVLKAGAIAACIMLFASSTLAVDKVILKDGKVLEGTIVREVDGMIWIKYKTGSLEREDSFHAGEISKIERDAATAAAPVTPAGNPLATSPVPVGMTVTPGGKM